MHCLIQAVRTGSPQDYIEARFGQLLRAPCQTTVSDVIPKLPFEAGATPEIQERARFPVLGPRQEKELDLRRRCALETIAEESPLLPDEALEEDFFSYLVAPFGSTPAGTPVLRRTTNRAVLYYFFDNAHVDGGTLAVYDVLSIGTDHAPPLMAIEVTGMLIDLGVSILQWAGSQVLAEIFPDNTVPPYFTKVYAQIREIVKDELTQAILDTTLGEFTGVLRFVNNEYEPAKVDGRASDAALERLQRKSDDMFNIVGKIMPERFSMSGLPVFLMGAGTHLIMLQELSRQADLRSDGALRASLLGLGGSTFRDYASHAEKTYDAIVAARRAKVSVAHDRDCWVAPSTHDLICTDYFQYRDKQSGAKGPKESYSKRRDADAAKKKATAGMTTYLARTVADLTKTLQDPRQRAQEWREAEKKPHSA